MIKQCIQSGVYAEYFGVYTLSRSAYIRVLIFAVEKLKFLFTSRLGRPQSSENILLHGLRSLDCTA